MDIREWLKGGGVFVLPLIVFAIVYVVTDQIWQDYLMLMATLLISVTLVPTLLEPESAVPRTTSVPAALAVAMFVVATAGLELWLTAAGNALSFLFWSLVVVFRAP